MKGIIYINGLIGTFLNEKGEVEEKGVELIDVIMQVRNQPKAQSFNVYINSEGGAVNTGFEIYDYLVSLGKPINTIGQGQVSSIATIIFMAGENRELRPGTKLFLHLPGGGIEGNSDDIHGYAKMIKEVEKQILKFYIKNTGLSESEILPLMQKETFLNEKEAYKLGFSTMKALKKEPVAYFNKPKEKKMSKKAKQNVWNKIKKFLNEENILNKIVFDAEQNEIDFYELEEDDPIEVGAKARVDGQNASGEYKVPSEDDPEIVLTYVFENGELMEIREPEAEEEEQGDEMEALKTENEELKTKLSEIEGTVSNLKDREKSYKKVLNKIKNLESEEKVPDTEKKKQNPTVAKNPFSSAIANLKNK